MNAPMTEALHENAVGLDARPLPDIARILIESQASAAQVVANVTTQIARAASLMAGTIQAGGVLHYLAAGSSGLMAAADAQELGGTFSIPARQLRIHMAGGLPTSVEMPGATEDAAQDLETGLSKLNPHDTVIAVSASGTTPYTLAGARLAKRRSASVIGIANNPGSALLDLANVAICLETPAEVISGSTRLGAGTAQKIALNTMSTLMGVALGHVHDGMMVNVYADNTKLRQRAAGMVSRIAEVSDEAARAALETAGGAVKPAVLVALGASTDDAQTLLNKTNNNLRAALARLT